MTAPKTSVVLGGILIGSVFFTVPRYSSETAKRILCSESIQGDTSGFYVRNLMVVGLMGIIVFHVAITRGDLPSVWIGTYTDNLIVHLIGNLAYGIGFFYVFYKFFHLPYRYHRLLRYSPYGTVYTIASVFPVTATLMISIFDLPVSIADAPLSSMIAMVVLGILIAIPYALPLVFVKLRAEPYILALDAKADQT